MFRMPVVFLSHGAPISLEDQDWMRDLGQWGRSFPSVREILVISAHWVNSPLSIGPLRPTPLLYDFYGFPERFYQERYPSPVSTLLPERLSHLCGDGLPRAEGDRGLDHGMWVPLKGLFPLADIPVLGLSLPGLVPEELFGLGQKLAPLREEGVLILCSGGMTHNLGSLNPDPSAGPDSWARDFDLWVTDSLVSGDWVSILDFESRAPYPRRAHPTREHFVPLFLAMGAAEDPSGKISFPVQGFRWGNLSMKSVQFGGD